MKQLLLSLVFVIASSSVSAQFTALGNFKAYEGSLEGTDLNAVYLFNTLSGASFSFQSTALSVHIYRYRQSIADKELIPATDIQVSNSGGVTTYTVLHLLDGYGYSIEQDMRYSSLWIIDYSLHKPVLSSIEPIENEFVCDDLKLKIDKTDGLVFYGTSGLRRVIPQTYTITYNTLEWNSEQKIFVHKEQIIDNKEIGVEFLINPPLIDTKFKISGDQYASHFGITNFAESPVYEAIAVEPHIMPNDDQLGLSAPTTIRFSGYSNEPIADYYTWMICKVNDIKNPIARYTDRDIDYEFDTSGDFKVYLEVSNANSSCIKLDSVSISIGTSFLEVPNYFSPDASPGVNDEFRVASKSLVQFKCTIFNRNGTKLYQWSDPEKGWNGRVGGRFVNTGVYYYVIEAKGSDGKVYKQGGDINILRQK